MAGVAVAVLLGGMRLGWGETVHRSATAHRRIVTPVTWLAGAVAIFLLREHNFELLMLCTVMIFMIAGLGLTVQFGYAGVVNFAAAAFMGIGAYTTAVLMNSTALPHPVVILLSGLVSAVIGSVLLLPLLRTRGHYAALITIAFGILFRTFLEVNDALGGPQGLKVPGLELFGHAFNDAIEINDDVEWSFYLNYAAGALVVLFLAYELVRRIERSWMGLALDAVRLDETAASAFGLNGAAWKITAFSIGNFLAGVAGSLYATITAFIAPASFTFSDSLILVSIVILGGLGNPLGLLPAALVVVVLPEKLQVIQEYRFLLFAILVIAILLLRPGGLIPRRAREYPE
ncbi:MAG: branched-chain amino acid ABC transporter permease [Betaproteobacteria bacterium]|nr:branched-chain amino acid ABC transporter permease [Betaproteobacteria bacterium]